MQLEVVDTGVGMDEETRRRCLEPFFTTKGERGTGLGLAMVYGMVQRHSAEIEIDSTLEQGTTSGLRSPCAQAEADVAEQAARELQATTAAILLVDDDPLLLESLRATLESDGHNVTAADGGQAGIDSFAEVQQRGERFDVVITDLGMPYVDGRRVAAAVKAASPSTPVMLLTGWGQRLVDEGDMPAHVDHVLNKPPKLRDLRAALSTCHPAIGGTMKFATTISIAAAVALLASAPGSAQRAHPPSTFTPALCSIVPDRRRAAHRQSSYATDRVEASAMASSRRKAARGWSI